MTNLVIQRRPGTAKYFKEPLLSLEPEAISLDMLLVPGGSFVMGSPKDELERSDAEEPPHQVTVPSFFMGRYPVTQAQWQAVAALPTVARDLKPEPSNFQGKNRPVEQVSWYDTVEFCARLEVLTARAYRLPSEAEWEYACRAKTQTPFYFGNTLTTELANYVGNYTYSNGPTGEYRKETTPVDLFGLANAFGLCDMHGNVYEWCKDHWHSNYEDAPTDGRAWLSEDDKANRVRRGGSWNFYPSNCRSAYRDCVTPDDAYGNIGFRVVCSAPRILK